MLLLSGGTQKSQKTSSAEVVLFKAAAMKDIRSIHITSMCVVRLPVVSIWDRTGNPPPPPPMTGCSTLNAYFEVAQKPG
jgi:hypothetical protein